MIITAIERRIIIYCNRITHILNNNELQSDIIKRVLHVVGAPVKTVHREMSCDEIRVISNNNMLIINGKNFYSIDYNVFLNDYVFPSKLIACYKGVCWTCTSDYNLHIMKIERKWFNYIASRRKNIEGRIYDKKRRKIRIGDCILFIPDDNGAYELLYTVVIGLRRYNSFKEMLINEGIGRVLPDVHNINEGINVYYRYYSRAEEQKYGVLAIEIDLL